MSNSPTDRGVFAFDSKAKKWLNPPAKLYESDFGINRILASRDAVWVATNEGVLKFDKTQNRWIHYTVLDGLADNKVYSIYLDDDYIYFGTARGLTKFFWNSPFRVD